MKENYGLHVFVLLVLQFFVQKYKTNNTINDQTDCVI